MKNVINSILTATTITTTATERLLALADTASEAVKAVETVVNGLYSTHEVESGAWAQSLERAIADLKAALSGLPAVTPDGDTDLDADGIDKAAFAASMESREALEPSERVDYTDALASWCHDGIMAERPNTSAMTAEEMVALNVFGPQPEREAAAIEAASDGRHIRENLHRPRAEKAFERHCRKLLTVVADRAMALRSFNSCVDLVGAAVEVATAITGWALPSDACSGFLKDPERFVQPLVEYRQRLLAAREVSRALAATDEVLPGYLVRHLATHAGPTAVGSVFYGDEPCEPAPDGEFVRRLLGELEYREVQADPAWAMPGCRYFRGTEPLDLPIGREGVVPLTALEPDAELELVPVHGDEQRLEVRGEGLQALAKETDHVTVVVGPEQGRQVVYTAFPGDPTRPSEIMAAWFPEESRQTTAGALIDRLGADRAAKVTVKLV